VDATRDEDTDYTEAPERGDDEAFLKGERAWDASDGRSRHEEDAGKEDGGEVQTGFVVAEEAEGGEEETLAPDAGSSRWHVVRSARLAVLGPLPGMIAGFAVV
jgi:hypothetical protein